MSNEVTAAKAGEIVKVDYGPARGKYRHKEEQVKSPCGDKHNGQWYCLTHQEGFTNQFMKDTHIRKGDHKLVWICLEHGLEQP